MYTMDSHVSLNQIIEIQQSQVHQQLFRKQQSKHLGFQEVSNYYLTMSSHLYINRPLKGNSRSHTDLQVCNFCEFIHCVFYLFMEQVIFMHGSLYIFCSV